MHWLVRLVSLSLTPADPKEFLQIFTDPTLKLNSNSPSSIVDDRDPRFSYSSGWILGGVESEVDSTTHGSDVNGSTAFLTFNGAVSPLV